MFYYTVRQQTRRKTLCILLLSIIFLSTQAISQPKSLHSSSFIDWKEARIDSTLYLNAQSAGIELPTGRNHVFKILQVESPSLLKDTYFSILVDSGENLGLSVARKNIKLEDLNTLIDNGKRTAPYFSKDLATIASEHTSLLADIGALFIKHTKSYNPQIPLDLIASRPYTGIIIDARESLPIQGEYTQAKIEPCLFPKIWNENMEIVYEKNMVEAEIAMNRGIVSYTDSFDIPTYRSIVGTDPLRIPAKKLYGIYKTDPIISNEDYLKIMTVPENRKLLQEGRVVILCPPEQIKKTRLGPEKNENYYFVWQELNDELSRKPIKKVDFSDTWAGLKLTMYDVRFVADSDRLLNEETSRLDAIAQALLLTGGNTSFIIEGHTADVGKPSGEQELSVRRAQRIAEELINRGIPFDKIEWTGFGGTRPIGSNATEEGRAMNRRVEITIGTSKN